MENLGKRFQAVSAAEKGHRFARDVPLSSFASNFNIYGMCLCDHSLRIRATAVPFFDFGILKGNCTERIWKSENYVTLYSFHAPAIVRETYCSYFIME